MSNVLNIQVAGENALIIYFTEQASSACAAKVQQAEQLIRTQMANDIIDLVPSYASILVVFNMLDIDHHQLRNKLRNLLEQLSSTTNKQGRLVELPAYYSAKSGPDLARIAQHANLTVEHVIQLHQAQEYHVYAIGFAPGFAYLGEVDARIAMPRLATPRQAVPQGAVAIADRQTAVYPSVSPGGWNIIGLCPQRMFDASAKETMPVNVGDRVRFKAITEQEFYALGGELGVVK